ncbi:RNA polymerase sigma-70 factor [Marinilabilia sp.]
MRNPVKYVNNETLAAHLQEGRKEAYEYLYSNYYSALCQYALKFVSDPGIAEDIVAQIFFRLYEKRKDFELKNVRSYLFQSVRNASLNHIRDHKESLAIENQEELFDFPGSAVFQIYAEGLENMFLKDAVDALEKAMADLPPQTREVFRLSRFEQLSTKEIAARLGISFNTVETHISRALKKLRIALKDFLPFLIWFL